MENTVKPIEVISTPGDVFRISYMVSNLCNYDCSYCFPGSNEGTHRYNKDWQLVANNMKHLFSHYKQNSNKKIFDINITGGEPTLWPDLHKFCLDIKQDNDVMISLQSNGSRTLRWWQENGSVFSKVLLTAHHKDADIGHLITVADTLYALGVFVVVTVCMDPDHWEECVKIVEELKKSRRRWYIRLQKLEGNFEYTDEQKKYFKNPVKRLPGIIYAWKNRHKFYNKESKVRFNNNKIKTMSSHEISLNHWNHFNGWSCNLGVDSIFIDLGGNITGSCQQKIYGEDFYYNINDQDFVEKFSPTIAPTKCRQLGCYCVPEINMTKSKNGKTN